MAIEERDPHTGYLTTGHEWNGITELNRPVPKVIWLFLVSTIVFSVVYWILMPTWPTVESFSKGILGVEQRQVLADDINKAKMGRAAWARQVEMLDYAKIQADQNLMHTVRQTGQTLFKDNCAACHGMEGQGGVDYPRLTDDTWLWGGTPELVSETLRVGINSAHDESRMAQMPAFGRDGILDRPAILDVVRYVRSLSGVSPSPDAPPDSIARGAVTFKENCAACHGETGTGNVEMGAPDLTDTFWIYGSDNASIFTSVYQGRQGHMPHWEGRLSPLERKILTLFLLDLGEAAK